MTTDKAKAAAEAEAKRVRDAIALIEQKLRDAYSAGQDSMDRCALDL